jgi:hypothetical protein
MLLEKRRAVHPWRRVARTATRVALAAVLGILVAGCPRVLLPSGGNARSGDTCRSAAECADGYCEDSVCCSTACGDGLSCATSRARGTCVALLPGDVCPDGRSCGAGLTCAQGVCCAGGCDDVANPTRSCALPGREGLCSERLLGDGCGNAAECRSGQCVDGVCCDDACEGLCRSCALEGSVGRCQNVPDNADPEGECGDADAGVACLACFGRRCLPALAGTNPKGECAGSLVCNGVGRCLAPVGESCMRPADCASGQCFFGQCAQFRSQALDLVTSTGRQLTPLSVVLTDDGQPVVAWLEEDLGGTLQRSEVRAARGTLGGWVPLPVAQDFGTLYRTELVALGNWVLVVTGPGDHNACRGPAPVCDLQARWLSPEGTLAGEEVPWPGFADILGAAPPLGGVCKITSLSLDDGRLLLAVGLAAPMDNGFDTQCQNATSQDVLDVHILERAPSGTWRHVGNGATTQAARLLGLAMLDGAPAVLVLPKGSFGTLRLLRAGGVGNPQTVEFQPCGGQSLVRPSIGRNTDPGARRVVASAGCWNQGEQTVMEFGWNKDSQALAARALGQFAGLHMGMMYANDDEAHFGVVKLLGAGAVLHYGKESGGTLASESNPVLYEFQYGLSVMVGAGLSPDRMVALQAIPRGGLDNPYTGALTVVLINN